MKFHRVPTFVVIFTLLSNSVAFAANPGGVQALNAETRALRVSLDSGVAADVAIEAFAQAIGKKEISVEDVSAYARQRMSAREFRAFDTRMQSLLKGIEVSQLSAEELGQLVGEALAGSSSTGLAWSSCTTLSVGIAVAVAGAIITIVGLAKAKSDESIRRDFEYKRLDVTRKFAKPIELREQWETKIPEEIKTQTLQIASNQKNADYWWLNRDYEEYGEDGYQTVDGYDNYVSYTRAVEQGKVKLATLEALLARYQGNPELALVDAAEFIGQRDAEIGQLGLDEDQALIEAPGVRSRMHRLALGGGIGAGVGAAIIALGLVPSGPACEI